MGESKEVLISRLMEEGLRYYGEGQMEQAAECWQEVLRLDPDHPEAHDYLETAGFDDGAIELSETTGEGDANLLADALELFRQGELRESLELFETLAQQNPGRMEVQGYYELVRSHLFGYFRERVPEASGVLKVKIGPEEIMKYNLPADAGFLIAMIDGSTSAHEVLALSGMDPFDGVRMIHRLLEAGIVEASP
jgi:tetratricopeptide (TPR) repeat protein